MPPASAAPEMLPPEEQRQIAGAVGLRRREYAAVRQLARALLPHLGVEPCAILNGPDRAPVFPPGIIGSFTHSRELALAVLARNSVLAAIGCDVEERNTLPPEVSALSLSEEELNAIRGLPEWASRLLFSAKEATYKAQYALSRKFLDFHEVSIELNWSEHRFHAVLQTTAPPFLAGHCFDGRFVVTETLLVTAVSIPCDDDQKYLLDL